MAMARIVGHDCEHCELRNSCDDWNRVFKTDVCFDEATEDENKMETDYVIV